MTTPTQARAIRCPQCGKVLGESDGKTGVSNRGGIDFYIVHPTPVRCRCGEKLLIYPTGAVTRYNSRNSKAVAPISTSLAGV